MCGKTQCQRALLIAKLQLGQFPMASLAAGYSTADILTHASITAPAGHPQEIEKCRLHTNLRNWPLAHLVISSECCIMQLSKKKRAHY